MSIDLSQFPVDLASQLGITEFAGEILASTIFMMLLLVPVMFLAKRNHIPGFSIIIVSILGLGCCIGFGWLNAWFLLLIALLTGLLFAGRMREWISG